MSTTPRRSTTLALALAPLALLVLTVPAVSQLALGPDEIGVSTGSLGGITKPAAAMGADGRALVVWEDLLGGLVIRQLDVSGQPAGEAVSVLRNTPLPRVPFEIEVTEYHEPALIALGSGGYLLSWTVEKAFLDVDFFFEDRTTLDRDIQALRLDAGGNPVGAVLQVASGAGFQSRSTLIETPDGGIALAWQSRRAGTDGVWIRRLDATGSPIGQPVAVATGLAGWPSLAASRSAILVAWEGCCDQGADLGIFARLLSPDLRMKTGPIQVNHEFAGGQRRPAAASDLLDNFMVVWQSPTDGHLDDHRIFGRRVNRSGTLIGKEIAVSHGEERAHSSPRIAAGRDHNFVITWLTWPTFFPRSVDGVEILAAGGPLEERFRLSSEAIRSFERTALVTGVGGAMLAGWAGYAGDAQSAKVRHLNVDRSEEFCAAASRRPQLARTDRFEEICSTPSD